MFKDNSLKQYLTKMGVQYPALDLVAHELVEIANKYHLYVSVNKLQRIIMCYGNLVFSQGSLEYIVPIGIDIPPDYPQLLPNVKTSLFPLPASPIFEQNFNINYIPLMGTKQITLLSILDTIVEKCRELVLSDFPFRPASSSIPQQPQTQSQQIVSIQPVPHNQPNEMKLQQQSPGIPQSIQPIQMVQPQSLKPLAQPTQNDQPFLPLVTPQMPTLPSTPQSGVTMPPPGSYPMQSVPPPQQQLYKHPVYAIPRAKTIIVEEQIARSFSNIDEYLDQIDREKDVSNIADNYRNLLKTNVITKEEFNQLMTLQTNPSILPPPPKEYEDVLAFYKQGLVSRAEVKHQIPTSTKSSIVIKNMNELDANQKVFAEMFLEGRMSKDELVKINYDYYRYCEHQVRLQK